MPGRFEEFDDLSAIGLGAASDRAENGTSGALTRWQAHWTRGDLRTMACLTVGWKDSRFFNATPAEFPVQPVMLHRQIRDLVM
jgi:hypothetical protein